MGDNENTYYEEFLLIVRGSKIKKLARASSMDGDGNVHFYGLDRPIPQGWKIVKAYQPEGNEEWRGTDNVTEVVIGYHEERLTALERLAIKCYVSHYWDIPF